MRAWFYASYAFRALGRGGQRTTLAVFCIAVGVMAIVGLQLVSAMVSQAITSNARAVNQGDLSVGLSSTPLQPSDLSFFDGLRTSGTIVAYTPLASSGGILQLPDGRRHTVSVRIVDPSTFPLIGSNRLVSPDGTNLGTLLRRNGSAVASSRLFDDLDTPLGSRLRVLATSGALAQVTLAGVARTDNATWTGNQLTVSAETWQAATKSPVAYQTVAVTTTGPAQTQQAVSAIRRQFPIASIRTTNDVLQQAQRGVETTRKFLVIIGLLALLIGGVGIVNTMQVLLSRRRVEIAVLKTSGYRRRDLYLLFGIEAAMLGLAGGVTGGILGIGVAAGLRTFFVHAFPLVLPFSIDPGIVLGGVGIGLMTALIFGLLPIVRAAAIRPQAVLRDLPEWQGAVSRVESAALVLLVSLLFFVLAATILHSLVWGAVAVYGVFAAFSVIGALLGGILWLLSRLPVPDRLSLRHLALVTAAVVATLLLTAVPMLRGVAILMLAFALLGYAVVLVPGSWRVSIKLALRNIGRARARTTTTLLALLIGVFSVGLILVLGQDLRANLGQAFANQLAYNVVAVSTEPGGGLLQHLNDIPGVQSSRTSNFVAASAVAINGRQIAQFAPGGAAPTGGSAPGSRTRQQLRLLNGIQGYDVAKGDVPNLLIEMTTGRNLDADDADTANVIVQDSLRQPPLRLSVGSTVTLKRPAGDTPQTFTVVGFYKVSTSGTAINFSLAPVFGPQAATARLAGDTPFQIVYLQIASNRVSQATQRIQQVAPDVVVLDLEDFLTQFTQILNNILIMLTAIASLALVAGIIIVANAVALAMLERRRELGILKAVGYTSGRVLAGVLMENALTAGLGGLIGMAPVSVAVAVFNRQAGVSFGVAAPLSIAIVLGVVALATVTTIVVAWGAVRVRPLTILRYE